MCLNDNLINIFYIFIALNSVWSISYPVKERGIFLTSLSPKSNLAPETPPSASDRVSLVEGKTCNQLYGLFYFVSLKIGERSDSF